MSGRGKGGKNRGKNYLKIRDLLSIALFNILGTHYSIHI
jgi:hypothetical protein